LAKIDCPEAIQGEKNEPHFKQLVSYSVNCPSQPDFGQTVFDELVSWGVCLEKIARAICSYASLSCLLMPCIHSSLTNAFEHSLKQLL